MSHRAIAALAIFLAFPTSAAASWKLHIFADAGFTTSSIDDQIPGIVSLHVVETGTFIGATGVRFSAKPGPSFTGVWLGDVTSFVTNGSSPTDLSVGYGACIPPPIHVVTMLYQLFGTSAACSELRIEPGDAIPCVLAPDVDCTFTEACIQEFEHLRVNCPVATQPTTWGKVKALYRN